MKKSLGIIPGSCWAMFCVWFYMVNCCLLGTVKTSTISSRLSVLKTCFLFELALDSKSSLAKGNPHSSSEMWLYSPFGKTQMRLTAWNGNRSLNPLLHFVIFLCCEALLSFLMFILLFVPACSWCTPEFSLLSFQCQCHSKDSHEGWLGRHFNPCCLFSLLFCYMLFFFYFSSPPRPQCIALFLFLFLPTHLTSCVSIRVINMRDRYDTKIYIIDMIKKKKSEKKYL